MTELTFLEHHLNSQGTLPLQEKITAIQDFSRPRTKRKLQEFLGLVNFYHQFVPHCAHILLPINKLLTATQGDNKPL